MNGAWAGAWIGLAAGLASAAELIHGNRALLDPRNVPVAVATVAGAFGIVAGAAGLLAGASGARLRSVRGSPADRASFFAFLVVGLLAFPPAAALAGATALAAARVLRRRAAPHRSRLDGMIALATVAGCATFSLFRSAPESSSTWTNRFDSGAPAVGSIPVTISVHRDSGFPEIPAVHVHAEALASGAPGRRAALWSGVAPARTPPGADVPRRLPGGGTIAWNPPRPLPRALVPLLAAPVAADDSLFARRPLEEIVRAAGIPILRGPPLEGDPPLWLRIVESDAPLERETAERAARAGAWIDVRFADHDEIALGGSGFRLAPIATPVSLLDVTPTALHLLGLAGPRDCDGRVLFEALQPGGPGGRTPRYRTRARRSSTMRR